MAVNPDCTTSYKLLADFEYFYSAIMPELNTIRRSHEQFSQQTDGLCVPGPKHFAGGRLRGLDQAIGYGAAGISSGLVRLDARRVGKACVSSCRFRWHLYHYRIKTYERLI